jgi:adenylate kinase family enzyme
MFLRENATMPLHLDLKTAVVTLVAVPLIYFVFVRTRDFIKRHVSLLLDAVFWVLGRIFIRSIATQFSLKRYCRIKLNDPSSKYLHVPGRSSTALETDAIFVPLEVEGHGEGSSDAVGAIFSRDKTRVRVIGDPGSGKSSLTKQIFRKACRIGESASRRSRDARLPILIELKRFVPPPSILKEEDAAKWAAARLREEVESVRGFEMGKLFDSFVSDRGLLVLLDGLDEVASDDYPRTAMAIRGLSTYLSSQSAANLAVLTMRGQFHQQIHADFDDEFPVVFQIVPFKPTDIFQFLERWPFAVDRFAEVSRIYSDLTDRPTLREMCSNPLVLAMYVANDQQVDAQQSAPDTRTSFYNQVVDELLVARRSRQLLMAARTTLREQREQLLGSLALENLCDSTQPANSISWKAAVRRLIELTPGETAESAAQRLNDLARDTGIISIERENESFRFIHLTFCEFLAAKEAAVGRKDGWASLLAQHRDFQRSSHPQQRSRLNETIPFATALLPRSQREDALVAIANLDSYEILGRCLLEVQAYTGDVWENYVRSERTTLHQPRPADWDSDWLRQLHLFSVVLHDAEDWYRLSGLPFKLRIDDLFSDLVGRDRERLVKVFSAYAANDPAAALRLAEACGVDVASEHPSLVLENCQFPPFLAVALQRAAAERGRGLWTLLIAETGLIDPLAAFVMSSREAPEELWKSFETIPSNQRWAPLATGWADYRVERVQPKKTSCYSVILTLALGQNAENRTSLPALKTLETVPPPGSVISSVVLRWATMLLMLGIMISVTVAFALSATSKSAFVPMIIMATMLLLPGYVNRRERYYAVAANLAPAFEARKKISTSRLTILSARIQAAYARIYLRRLDLAVRELERLRGEEHRVAPLRSDALLA